MEDFLIAEFYEEMSSVEFNALGIIDSNNRIHTLGTDSKIIGRIFEMFTQPILEKIAKRHGMILATPTSQTTYPDFIMMSDAESTEKIAIDVKTTYVDNDQSSLTFTLGSYASYMRNNTKNIEFQYTDYSKHYVIGFIYRRNGAAQESAVYDYADREKIICPFYDVKYFIQEKYKIAGDKPGSGNTENIGSFSTKKVQDLIDGNGPFSELGSDAFNLYWKYYPKYRSENITYKSLEEFIRWFPMQDQAEVLLLHEYNYAYTLDRIKEYAEKLKHES